MSLADLTTESGINPFVLDNSSTQLEKINNPSYEEIIEFLKSKGIVIDSSFRFLDPDILAVFPGNFVIRRSETIAKMNRFRFGVCKYLSRCENCNPSSYKCSYNNYNCITNSGVPICYIPIQINVNGVKKT